jgi:hypothetical protein
LLPIANQAFKTHQNIPPPDTQANTRETNKFPGWLNLHPDSCDHEDNLPIISQENGTSNFLRWSQ